VNEIRNEKLIKAFEDCADQLEHLNGIYPKLASDVSHEGVQYWRKRKGEIHLVMQEIKKRQGVEVVVNLRQVASDLLVSHSIEEVLDMMLQDHGVELTVTKLVKMVGKQTYLSALRKEVGFLHKNGISNEQIAELWNELERPGPGGEPWSKATVTLIAGE
jgi:hypothetical protein